MSLKQYRYVLSDNLARLIANQCPAYSLY